MTLIEQLRNLRVQREGPTIEKLEADLERALEALKPLATIPLWRDTYPDGPDILSARGCKPYIKASDVRAARAAIGIVG